MIIRDEKNSDIAHITALTESAFASVAYSDGTEAHIVNRLRNEGDLALSLVAEETGRLLGHVAFSRVTISETTGDWYGLAPVSVAPDRQREGIGQNLVRYGLRRLRKLKASGCVLIGSPDYYLRFGFQNNGSITYQDVPSLYVHWLSFNAEKPQGEVAYAPAFDTPTPTTEPAP